MTSIARSLRLSGLLLLLLLSATTVVLQVEARNGVLDAKDLAVGDWDIQLRCGTSFFKTVLFPSSSSLSTTIRSSSQSTRSGDSSGSSDSDYKETMKLMAKGKRTMVLPPLPFLQTKSHLCRLSLFPNGTFALRPKQQEIIAIIEQQQQQQQDGDNHQNQLAAASGGGRLLLRGRWKVEPNPYCITDRFYDELHLESYPRKLLQKQSTKKARFSLLRLLPIRSGNSSSGDKKHYNKDDDDDEEEEELRRLSLQLHCRMSGRYATPGPWKRIQGMTDRKARLTRGMLVWKSNQPAKSNRDGGDAGGVGSSGAGNSKMSSKKDKGSSPMGASFQGKRIVKRYASNAGEDQEELDFFGY